MLGVFFLILCVSTGIFILQLTKVRFYFLELIALATVIGIVTLTFFSFLVSIFIPLNWALIITSLMSICLVFFVLKKQQQFSFLKLPATDQRSYLLLYVLTSLLLLYLLFTHLFQVKSDGWYSGGSTWGDLAIHSTYVEYFSQQKQLSLTNPIFATEQTTYPFLIDWFAALLVRWGASLQWALLLSSFLPIFAGYQLLFFFVYRMSKSSFIAYLSALLFYSNGGVGAYYFLQDWRESGTPFFNFLFQQTVEYAHLADKGIYWSNVVVDYVLPQRGFAIGLAIFLSVSMLWQSYWRNGDKRTMFVAALLIGLTPFFHTHTYLTLFGIFIWLAAYQLITKKMGFLSVILHFFLLLFLSLPQLYWQIAHTHGSEFITLHLGWLNEGGSIFVFWFKNMGVAFLFLIFSPAIFYRNFSQYRYIQLLFLPLLILFVLTNIVSFQPHVYDNMKFMLYTYLILSIVMALLLQQLWQKSQPLTATLVFLLTITGALSILRESYTSWKLADNEEIRIAAEIKKITPPDAVFLTDDEHRHPVPMLAGRPIVMGYRGWLWTHGINYRATENDVATMFAGGPTAEKLLQKYGVDYVYIGENERSKWAANEAWFAATYPAIIKTDMITLYQVDQGVDITPQRNDL